MIPIRNSAKAIIIQDGCLLVIRNKDKDGDWYILPGGGQNHGEILIDALKRECREEIGVSVQVGDLKLIREYIGRNHEFAQEDGDAHQVEMMFECRIEASAIPKIGHTPDTYQTGVEWLPLTELENYRLYPKVLCTILKNGLKDKRAVYLGDVN